MAKKTRKQSKARKRPPQHSQVAPAPQATTTVAPSKKAASTAVDLAAEYHYVFADLRKIAIIAAAMFVLLFVLAFVLK